MLLFLSDIIQELIESDNDKFEDISLFVKKETVYFLIELFHRLVGDYRFGYLIDDFVRLVYDKKLIAA